MSEKDQVRLNFHLPKEVDDLLALYERQTGIKMSVVVRQVISDWVDSTVRLRGAMTFQGESRRTGVWMPRRLMEALEAKLEPLTHTRGQVISRLVYQFLRGRVSEEGSPSQVDPRQDPELLREALKRLYRAVKALAKEIHPSKEADEEYLAAMELAEDMIGDEHDRSAATADTHPTEADALA